MRKLTKTLILSIIGITLSTAIYINHVMNVNEEALEQARITTIRSNIGKYIVAPNVVKIVIKENGMEIGSATGFYVDYLGKVRLVTNKHVCDAATDGRTIFINEKEFSIVKISDSQDLCLLKSDRAYGLEIAAHDVGLQDKVILVGHPRGLALTIREGFVMEYGSGTFDWICPKDVDYKQISTIAYPGNSGSPVTNENGEVVGVLFAGDARYITEALIVPYPTLIKFLQSTYNL